MDEISDTSDDTTPWRKATASTGTGGCVEVRRHNRKIQLRDSKRGDQSRVLDFTRHEFACFLEGSSAGEFDDLLNGPLD